MRKRPDGTPSISNRKEEAKTTPREALSRGAERNYLPAVFGGVTKNICFSECRDSPVKACSRSHEQIPGAFLLPYAVLANVTKLFVTDL
jgi:hypothetical protein